MCYKKLNLLLIALEEEGSQFRRGAVIINPGSKTIIKEDTIGIFIAENSEFVKRYNSNFKFGNFKFQI